MEKKDEFPCFRKSAIGTVVQFTEATKGITVPLDGSRGVRSDNFWRYDDEIFWTTCEAPQNVQPLQEFKEVFSEVLLERIKNKEGDKELEKE